ATNAFLDHVLAHYALTPEDRCSQIFDLAWDAHTHDYWVTWSAGACLVVPTAEQQLLPATFLREADLTLWYGVPSTLLAMQRQRALAPGGFPGLRHVLLVGEALPVDLAAAMQSAAPQARVTNAYGPTEASCTCLHYTFDADRTPDEAENGVVPIGIPHRGTRLRVVDERGDDVAPGEPGELWLAGDQLAAGYLHDPARTAAAFVTVGGERWYRTGDRVRRPVHDEGPVVFLGRVDRQVQVSGSRIELGEVEAKLRDAEGVEAVAVVPWPVRGDVVEGLTAFVVGADLDERALRRWAKGKLHTLAVPRRFVRLDALPLNRNGKLDRDALIERLRGHSMPTEN
ncbi:MAG: AMP-binding protein, partial [Myxococcota bacterium]